MCACGYVGNDAANKLRDKNGKHRANYYTTTRPKHVRMFMSNTNHFVDEMSARLEQRNGPSATIIND